MKARKGLFSLTLYHVSGHHAHNFAVLLNVNPLKKMKSEVFYVKGIKDFEEEKVYLKAYPLLVSEGKNYSPHFVSHEKEKGVVKSVTNMIMMHSTTGFHVKVMSDMTVCIELPCWASKMDVHFCYAYLKTIRMIYGSCQITTKAGLPANLTKDSMKTAWERRKENARNILLEGQDYVVRGCYRDFFIAPSRYGKHSENQLEILWKEFARLQWLDNNYMSELKHAVPELPTEYRHVVPEQEVSSLKILENNQMTFVGDCRFIGLLYHNTCKIITHEDFFLLTRNSIYVERLDAIQFIIQPMPLSVWKDIYNQAQGICIKNYRRTFILRWNTDNSDNSLEDFCSYAEEFFKRPSKFSYSWSVWDYAKARIGDRFYMVRTGNGSNGIVMKGTFSSNPYVDDDWSGRGRRVHYILMNVENMINPEIAPLLMTPEKLQKIIPNFCWTDGHSGEILSASAAEKLEESWDDYLVKAQKAHRQRMKTSKYYGNPMADAVIRVDQHGRHFIRYQESALETGPCDESCVKAFGGEYCGIVYKLVPITRNDWGKFGKKWFYDWNGKKCSIECTF